MARLRRPVTVTKSSSSQAQSAPVEGPFAWASESAILATMTISVGSVLIWLASTRETKSCMLLREIAAGGTAAAAAEIVLYPIEVLKVKRQTRAKISGISEILYRRPGVAAGTARALLYHGLRLGLFPAVKRIFPGQSEAVGRKILLGAACGALGSLLCNPFDLAKTRLQRDPDRYANSLHALLTIPAREGGAAALWLGAPASVFRASSGSAGQLATYDIVKETCLDRADPNIAVLLATVISSVAYVTAAAPFDVVKARLMVASDRQSRPASVVACLFDICRQDGPFGLFAGWLPALLRLLPTTIVVFPLLERLRVWLGAGAF